ncbi:MAG: phosphohistidine phosphatase SixA [Betaproteobacteria bacterium]
MFLYLVQHGEARKEEEDPARGLTEKGIDDVTKVAADAGNTIMRVSRIFHSGKTRAMQTAKILADHLKPEKDISQTDDLAPMDDPEVWARRLAGMNEDIMLVGHLPYMAKLSGILLCGEKEKTFIDFKMGGIVCLKRFEDGRWAVEWMIVPEMVT